MPLKLPSLAALALAGGAWAASPYDLPYGTQWNFSAGAAGLDVRSGNSVDVTSDGTIFVFNGAHNSVSWGEGSSGSINGGVGAITPLGNKLFGTTLRSLPGLNNPNQMYNAGMHTAGSRAYGAFYGNSSQYWTGEDGKDSTRGMVFSLDSSGLSSIADTHSLSIYSDNNGTLRTDSLKPTTTGLTPVDGQNRIAGSALRKSTLDMVMVMDMVNGDFGTTGDYGGYGLRDDGAGNAYLPGIGVYNFTANTLSGPAKQPILTYTRSRFEPGAEWWRPETYDVTCTADTAGSLNGKYFDLVGASGTHSFWLDVDNTGTAPGDPGAGVHEIDITADATADAVAAATQAVIDAQADFDATVSTNTVTVADTDVGNRGNPNARTSGFTLSKVQDGVTPSNMGVYGSAGIDQATGAYYGGGISHSRSISTSMSDGWDPDGSGPAASIPIVNSVLNGPRDFRGTTAAIGTAYDASHNLLYAVTWDTTGYDNINFIAPTNDGTNGCFWAGEQNDAAYIEKRDASGTVIWSDVINATIDIVPVAEVTDIQCVADVASSLNGTYFDLTGAGGTQRFWIDVDNTGTAPADPGAGVYEIDITAGATADAVATATQAVIDAQADFGAAVSTDTVTVTDADTGDRTDATDSGTTGFTITVTTQGATFNPGVERVASVEVDSTGDLFVVGYFQNEADGGATGGANAYDTFVRKYKKNAEDDYSVVWATSGGLPAIRDLGQDAALDSDGTLYTFSDTYGQWDTNNPTLHTYAGNADILVLKWIPGDFADGTGAAGSDGIVDFKDVQLIGDAVAPGLTGDDTYDFNKDGDSTTADVNHLITELIDRDLSDIHQDALVSDVDNADIGKAIGNLGTGTLYVDGDTDWDGDVDADDVAAVAGAFTGAVGSPSERTTRPAGTTLTYVADKGRVILSADGASGGVITSFQLENGEGSFVPGAYTGPTAGSFGGDLAEATADVLADTDLTLTGFTGDLILGNVFPTGLDEAGLEAYLTTAVYTGAPGSGQMDFELVYLPTLPTPYENYVGGFEELTNTFANIDFEGDNLSTGLEFVLGGDPTVNDSASITPTSETTPSGLVFTHRLNAAANDDPDANFGVFWSTDLQNWTLAENGVDSVVIDPTEDFYEEGIDRVMVTLPSTLAPGGRLFARLSVTGLPELILSEDFEGGDTPAGWTTSGEGTVWSVGTPAGDGTGDNSEPPAAAGGTFCAGTNMNGKYTPLADARLVTPAFTVPAGGATLQLSYYIDTESGDGGQDFGSIRLLNAADGTPLEGGELKANLQGVDLTWVMAESMPLPAAAVGQEVKIEFRFESDDDTNNWAGFYIDDVLVTSP